jgi:hypothetical protein
MNVCSILKDDLRKAFAFFGYFVLPGSGEYQVFSGNKAYRLMAVLQVQVQGLGHLVILVAQDTNAHARNKVLNKGIPVSTGMPVNIQLIKAGVTMLCTGLRRASFLLVFTLIAS